MSCDAIREKLYEYLFDLLDDAERRQVEQHLKACKACREALDAAARERDLLGQWDVGAPPKGLARAAVARAQAASKRKEGRRMTTYQPVEPEWKWLGSRRFWGALAAVAALLIVVVGGQSLWVSTRRAGPQEAFLYGQALLTPGQPAVFRAFVRNGETAEPIHGADVRLALYSSTGARVWKAAAVTDDHGFARIEHDVPADLAEGEYQLKLIADSDAGTSDVTRPVEAKRSFRVLVTTDKPLYQPGQTIHIRTLALATADMRPVGERDIVIEVQDAKGNKVFKKKVQTSEYGISSADFVLADQVNTGDYLVGATVGDTTSERSVTVKRYRLPKFRIDLSTDRGYYAPGDVLTGDLVATYTFGKPVAGGKVHVVASEFIEKFREFATFDGVTDSEGRCRFTIPLKQHFVGSDLKKGDAFVSLEATVTDQANHTQKKTLDRTVTTRPIRIELFPESGRLVQGVENILYVVTAYPDGRPAQTELTIGATGKVVKTSEVGIAKVRITPQHQGLQLTVTAEDDKGVRARVTKALEVGARNESLLLRTDRAVYQAGKTANITVLSADRVGRVFLDVVKDHRTTLMKAVEVKDGRGALVLDLPPDLFGTLELHAYRIMTDGNIVSDTKIIQVNRADDLKITAKLDKDTYRPAEKALLKFIVTRSDGAPAPAALSLAGVDEAVFALHEMRPGLERIYFALQEEILKPRYEIHAQFPATPNDAVVPEVEQTPEREEATVVLFSAAEGAAAPTRDQSETFGARQQRYDHEKHEHVRSVKAALAMTPTVLFLLIALPFFAYALAKLFRRRPVHGPGPELGWLRLAGTRLAVWWVLGLYLPIAAAIGVAALADASDVPGEAALAVLAAVVVALGVLVILIFSAARLRRCAASRGVPALRKLAFLLPVAYMLAACGVAAMVIGADAGVLDEGTAAWWTVVSAAVMCALVGAVAVAYHCAVRRVSASRWLELAISRPTFAGLPLFVILLFLPALGGARCMVGRERPGIMERAFQVADGLEPGIDMDMAKPTDRARGEGPESAAEPAKSLKAPTRVRRFFPETLLWRPELITDPAGRAQLEIPLADSITTWRIAMSAVSKRGELGAGQLPLRVFQDFFVDIDFPVALTQNDFVSVPVAVYNYMSKPQTVRLEVQRGDWFELTGPPVQTLRIGPKQITSVHFGIRARKPGRHSLLLKAHGSEMADAVERRVIVRPDGKEFIETINGRLAENLSQEIVIPEEAIDGANDLLVKIYPGAFSQVLEGLDSIFQMPFGCFEQTSSATYPNILVLDYMRRTKQIKPDIEMKALNFINVGYQRLLSYEVKGGGFDWFGRPPAHTVLSAYGLMEFADMAKVYDIDRAVITRTRNWLYSKQRADGAWEPTEGGIAEGAINQFQGAALRTTAYIAWAMAESGESDSRMQRALEYILKNARSEDDTYTVALCANAMIAADRAEAKRFLDQLDAGKKVDGELVHWTSSAKGLTHSYGNVLEIETTALAAYAMLKSGRYTGTAHKALAWLIANKDPRGTWHSTQATVHAMRALLAGGGASGEVKGEINVTIAANGKVAKELKITEETSDVFHLVSLRPFVKTGKNIVALEAAGKGNLAYQIVATHYRPWPSEAGPARQKELTIDVAYNTRSLKSDDTLKATVTIRYNRPGVANMTIVDLGIPPGFAVMPEAFAALKDKGVIGRYSMTGRQVILYFREIRSGEPITFEYRLRAKFPVKVKTPQSLVYQYYEPELRDVAEPVELVVR